MHISIEAEETVGITNVYAPVQNDVTEKLGFFKDLKAFCGFSMGRNQYWAGRVYDLCVYYMTGTPEGSTESGFMEKPGIEPATPGLQDIALIHYTKIIYLRLKNKNL